MNYLKLTVLLLFLCPLTFTGQELSNSKPNIIIIMPDDISWGEHSYYGGNMPTPHIDNLFESGLRFNSFHVSPTCSPTRAALLTGEHEFYAGVTHTIFMRDVLSGSSKLIPQMLKEVGYTTGMFGKWHLGDDFKDRPKQKGFDEVLQHGAGGITQNYPHSADFPGNNYNNPYLVYNEKLIKETGFCTDIFFDYALNWIDKVKRKKKPFFVYLPTNVAHVPHIEPESTQFENDQIWKGLNEKIIKNLDWNVGKLMKFLSDNDLDENTLVIYFTDNGAPGAKAKGLLGGKGKASEGGIRVPCVFYWKGKIQNTGIEIDQLTGHLDLYRTFANLAGHPEKINSEKLWGGKDLTALLESPTNTLEKRYWVGHRARWRKEAEKSKYTEASIQDEEFKLYFKSETKFTLHNLNTDLGEKIDIKEQYPEKVAELKKQFDLFWEDTKPYMVNDANEIPEFHKPYHQLFLKTYGQKAFDEAMEKQLKFDNLKKELRKKK